MDIPRHEVLAAYDDYDREVTISNFKVACVLGMVLMPAGFLLDYFVYPNHVWGFLALRLCSSLLIAVFLALLLTRFGRSHYRLLGIILLLIPTAFISAMIQHTEGAASPYYAGLNLVLLMIAFVLRWTFWESLIAVVLVLALYLTACFTHRPAVAGMLPAAVAREGQVGGLFFSNLYFLILTGIIVVTGNYFLSALRFREFALRYELDRKQRELEESNRKLKELDQLKSRFFANISHELRTPLTLLLAPLESILNRLAGSLAAETRELVLTMHTNGLRLLKLINDLLDLVRLDAGAIILRREPIRIANFLGGLITAVGPVAAQKDIQVSLGCEPEVGAVLADRDKLEKVLLNLLFNALKFTPAGGRVTVRASAPGEWLVLEVVDTGIGISEQQLPHVFDRFWQGDSSARRRHQGAGIGLALTKELTELQGGDVSVVSEEGRGSTFTVRLPCLRSGVTEILTASGAMALPGDVEATAEGDAAEGSAAAVEQKEWLASLYRRAELSPVTATQRLEGESPTAGAARALPRVLIADDEADMRRFLRSQLRSDYEVFEAVDGTQAVNAAGEIQPSLIVLDMMMPEKDGLQVCRELRNQAATQTTPILMVTARVDEETKLAALSSGANDFLLKPFSITELHLRVRNLIAAQELQQRLAEQNRLLAATLERLKDTQSQLVQAEKLTSLGRLSAGIIHEINNPLNFAATGLYALRTKQRHLPGEHQTEFNEIMRDVEEGISRVRNIVSDLRTFTFPNAAPTDDVNLADTIAVALRFLSHEWTRQVKVLSYLPAGLTVRANRNKLVQVFVNLLQNAADALKRKVFDHGGPQIEIEAAPQGDQVRVVIRDNGPGIDPAILDKIFDPFFTTKDVGEGMGLGLSICYRIMQEAQGQISVRSEPGQFTEFTLMFPLPSAAPKIAVAAPAAS